MSSKTNKTSKKASSKPASRKTSEKKGDAYECRICGYRVVVDEACGCAEKHVLICCNKLMTRKASG